MSTAILTGFALVSLWANDGGDKVTRESRRAVGNPSAVNNSVWNGERVAIFGARNEVVSFNVVLEADKAGASAVKVAMSSLVGPKGHTIASRPTEPGPDGVFDWRDRPVEVFLVGYVPIRGASIFGYGSYDERHAPIGMRRPWTGAGAATGGWNHRPQHDHEYPDIAIPIEAVGAFDVPGLHSQSVWVDVYIPKGTPAGVYEGTFSVALSDIPVELTVRDFQLPDAPTAKTMVGVGYAHINHRYTGERFPYRPDLVALSRTVRDRHYQMAHRHRLSLVDGDEGNAEWGADAPRPEWLPRLNGELFTGAHGYDGPGVGVGNGVYSIGHYGSWRWKGKGEHVMKVKAHAWATWFATHSPATDAFLYLVDESSDYQAIERWARWVDSAPGHGSRLRTMATVPAPDAVEHTPSLDIVTSFYSVGPKTWAPAVAKLQAGRDYWMYNGFRPATGSFVTEDEGTALRAVAWTQFKMKVSRWFYWESTYFENFHAGEGPTNLFEQGHTFGKKMSYSPSLGETGWNYSNGDGVLFYPGTDLVFPARSLGQRGPLASLRMKHWRRGLQDAEYLALAAKKDPKRTAAIVQRVVPKVLWEYGRSSEADPTWVKTPVSWSPDPDVWEAARAELADLIEGGAKTD